MRIGIDIDDTVLDTVDIVIESALEYDSKFLRNEGFKDKNAYPFKDLFYWSDSEIKEFIEYYKKNKIYKKALPKKDAIYYINKLYNEGNEIYFITHRQASKYLDIQKETEEELTNKGFKYTKVFTNVNNKGIVANILKLDIFIDDSMYQINKVNEQNIKTILFKTRYNKKYNGLQMDNWQDIYNEIERN